MKKQKKISKKQNTMQKNDKCMCIEHNKTIITTLLSKNTTKRLNNFNWLRHEISFNESKNLFYMSAKSQSPYFDHSCTRGLGEAYDYILAHQDSTPITINDICQIHYLICNKSNISMHNSFIRAGVIKQTTYPMEIETKLDNIIFSTTHNDKPTFLQAFDLHYQIILLQPFDEYNKRTARMIMNWFLIKHGYHPVMFTQKSDKTKYPEALLKMKMNDSNFYYKYMIKSMQTSQEKIITQLRNSKVY